MVIYTVNILNFTEIWYKYGHWTFPKTKALYVYFKSHRSNFTDIFYNTFEVLNLRFGCYAQNFPAGSKIIKPLNVNIYLNFFQHEIAK